MDQLLVTHSYAFFGKVKKDYPVSFGLHGSYCFVNWIRKVDSTGYNVRIFT